MSPVSTKANLKSDTNPASAPVDLGTQGESLSLLSAPVANHSLPEALPADVIPATSLTSRLETAAELAALMNVRKPTGAELGDLTQQEPAVLDMPSPPGGIAAFRQMLSDAVQSLRAGKLPLAHLRKIILSNYSKQSGLKPSKAENKITRLQKSINADVVLSAEISPKTELLKQKVLLGITARTQALLENYHETLKHLAEDRSANYESAIKQAQEGVVKSLERLEANKAKVIKLIILAGKYEEVLDSFGVDNAKLQSQIKTLEAISKPESQSIKALWHTNEEVSAVCNCFSAEKLIELATGANKISVSTIRNDFLDACEAAGDNLAATSNLINLVKKTYYGAKVNAAVRSLSTALLDKHAYPALDEKQRNTLVRNFNTEVDNLIKEAKSKHETSCQPEELEVVVLSGVLADKSLEQIRSRFYQIAAKYNEFAQDVAITRRTAGDRAHSSHIARYPDKFQSQSEFDQLQNWHAVQVTKLYSDSGVAKCETSQAELARLTELVKTSKALNADYLEIISRRNQQSITYNQTVNSIISDTSISVAEQSNLVNLYNREYREITERVFANNLPSTTSDFLQCLDLIDADNGLKRLNSNIQGIQEGFNNRHKCIDSILLVLDQCTNIPTATDEPNALACRDQLRNWLNHELEGLDSVIRSKYTEPHNSDLQYEIIKELTQDENLPTLAWRFQQIFLGINELATIDQAMDLDFTKPEVPHFESYGARPLEIRIEGSISHKDPTERQAQTEAVQRAQEYFIRAIGAEENLTWDLQFNETNVGETSITAVV